MALTTTQALDVVIGSVKKVGGHLVGPTDTLEDGGVDAERVPALISTIVGNRKTGVPQFQHEIEPSTLADTSSGDDARDVADVVKANATPVEPSSTKPKLAASLRSRRRGKVRKRSRKGGRK